MVTKKKTFSSKIGKIRARLHMFTVKLLDLCDAISDVELFLDQDSTISGISMRGTNMLPRIFQAGLPAGAIFWLMIFVCVV